MYNSGNSLSSEPIPKIRTPRSAVEFPVELPSLSFAAAKIKCWRRKGCPSGPWVELALAMLFATISIRRRSAAMPLALIPETENIRLDTNHLRARSCPGQFWEKTYAPPGMQRMLRLKTTFEQSSVTGRLSRNRAAHRVHFGSQQLRESLIHQAVLFQIRNFLVQVDIVAINARN